MAASNSRTFCFDSLGRFCMGKVVSLIFIALSFGVVRAMAQDPVKVDPKHYQAFDLYVVKQWPVSAVARTLSINPGKVYLIKHRIASLIKKEINHLQAKPI